MKQTTATLHKQRHLIIRIVLYLPHLLKTLHSVRLRFSLRKETMYPKKDYFSFISIETTHNTTVSWRKNNTAADIVANLLIFCCILDH